MWKWIAIGAAAALVLLGAGGVGFTLHQRAQCERQAGLWYDSLPDGRIGLDPAQVDWVRAYEPCAWASQFAGAPLHKVLFARAFLRRPLAPGENLEEAVRQRAAVADALLFDALPAYPYAVFEGGAEAALYVPDSLVSADQDSYTPPSPERVDQMMQLLARRVPVERAAYDDLTGRARVGDSAAATLLAMKSGATMLPYSSFALTQRALALAILGQGANPGDEEMLQRLRAKPGVPDMARRIADGLAPVALQAPQAPPVTETAAWALRAARANYAPAQFVIASLRGETRNETLIFDLPAGDFMNFLRQAAGQRLAPAQYELARLHIAAATDENTTEFLRLAGVPASRAEALRLLQDADSAGLLQATLALADGYLLGWFGEPDPDQAMRFYERSADHP